MIREIDDKLLIYSSNGNIAGVLECIAHGANVNVKDPETGLTAIHIAAGLACDGLLRVLLSTNKANLKIRDDRGRRAIDVARQYNHPAYGIIIKTIQEYESRACYPVSPHGGTPEP
jgi:ankyrin repeat protein